MPVIQIVKEALDIGLQHPGTAHLHRAPPLRVQHLVSRTTRTEALGAVSKVLLVHRFEHYRHRPLENFVFEGGDLAIGRVSRPPPIGMCARLTGSARYRPDLNRSCSENRFSSRFAA